MATLILILIAVAAAAALYLWLVAWQGGVTGGVGNPSAQTTVTIGGSTSVYPFTALAVTQFQQNQTDIAVSLNQGGSGAGMLAVCSHNVDIGEASALETVAQLQQPVSIGGYGCPQAPAPVITTVAYDAVDLIVPVANPHGLVSMSADTLFTVYQTVGGISASKPGGYVQWSVDGSTTNTVAFVAGTPAQWDQIPACVNNQANCNGATTESQTGITGLGAGTACGADVCMNAGLSP
ncbi:MAG TPA: substrate-binding domain-containing protein, partial [Thermoplasmata archaeon]|nr:substrate-binding domain-containing protein [Thermoplasmata archaeon]